MTDLSSRRVQILGSTPFPNDLFMRQVRRTLTAAASDLAVARRDRLGGLLPEYTRAA